MTKKAGSKTFLYRGHRYRIVFKTAGGDASAEEAVKSAKRMYKNSVVKKTSDGRYAVGVRFGKKGY